MAMAMGKALVSIVTFLSILICKSETIGHGDSKLVVTNSSCARMEFMAGFNVSYIDENNKQRFTNFEIPQEGLEVTGECKENENRIELAFTTEEISDARVLFTFISADGHYKLAEVKVSGSVSRNQAAVSATADGLDLFKVAVKSSHNCVSKQRIVFSDGATSGFIENAMVQAFMDNPSKFSIGVECPIDAKMDDIVPIAVGGAIAASAVVVIIGFLVANKGYSYKRIYAPSF